MMVDRLDETVQIFLGLKDETMQEFLGYLYFLYTSKTNDPRVNFYITLIMCKILDKKPEFCKRLIDPTAADIFTRIKPIELQSAAVHSYDNG